MQVISVGSRPVLDYETITVSNTAIGFTASKYIKSPADNFPSQVLKARSALVTVEGDAIRVSFANGVTPTANSNGHLFQVGDSFIVDGAQTITDLKMIRQTTDATVRVTYFG